MNNKLFVGNLPFAINDESLKEAFASVGEVQSAKVITDKFTGRSRGFGFVEMASEEEAQKAIDELDGKMLGDREMTVSLARPMENRA